MAQFNSMRLDLPLPRLNLPLTGGKLSQETTFFFFLFFLESHILKAVYFRSKVFNPKDALHPEIHVQV